MVAQTVEIAGKRLVILEEADYLRLCKRVTKDETQIAAVPAPGRSGRRPAGAYILASIARDIAADRKAAGLSQQELARQAGIRQETLSRIESGKHAPTRRTLTRIDKVLGKG